MARPIFIIAADIQRHWPKVNYAAKPYLEAMHELTNTTDRFGLDRGEDIVRYFLVNANTWRGVDAQRLKTELWDLLP